MSQGGEKTEKATPKKRRDAREKGQVLKSQEIITAFCMLCMFGFMLGYSPYLVESLMGLFKDYLGESFLLWGVATLETGAAGLLTDILLRMALLVAPIFGVALLAGTAANLLQVGFMFTTKTLAPKFERVSMLQGFKRMFSLQTLIQLLKSILKLVVLGYIFYTEYRPLLAIFPGFLGQNLYLSLIDILRTVFTIVLKMSLAMAIISAADFLYQFFKYEKDLKMTKQEVKDEYKLTEGDPKIKGRIRQKQRQMSMMRMMAAVPAADVVITNPTHFAVALQYEQGKSGAPRVVAKGQNHLARKIKEVAREHRVEIVENKPLAQSLYAMVEVGQEIPEELYQAVAEVLVYIHRKKHGQPRPAPAPVQPPS